MLRRLGIGITALALLWPGMAAALGVGDYSLNSYLNQPLDMEVTLRDTRGLNEEQLLVSLASDRDFAMAGIDRQSMHSELRFEVTINEDGSGLVRITTRQPVREPYLNFLVEYLWPTGRMLRDYTVLLDPPSYAADRRGTPTAPPASAPARRDAAPAASPRPAAPAAETPREPARVATQDRPRTQPAAPESGPRSTHTVGSSDTMWRIARDNRPSTSVSVQQMMVVIQDMNPDAFINGNVNLVREGAVLRLPTEQEVRATTTRDALASVADQNRQWREMLQARGMEVPGRQQLDGTPRTIEDSVATTRPDQGQVRLVAPESAGTGAGTGAGSVRDGDSAALQNELAIRDENLDQLRRENRELADRLSDLEGQVDTSEQILSLRNDQITRLQDELRRLREERGIDIEDDSLLAPVPRLIADEDEDVPTGDQTGTERAASDEDDAEEDVVAAAPAPIERDAPPPRPEPLPPAPAQPSLMDSLFGNPLLLAGAAGLLLLLVLLGVMARRRQQAAAADEEEQDEYEEGETFGDDDDFLPPLSHDDEDDVFGADGPMGDEAPMRQPGQDPVEQVEVFMAYGQYPQALSHLRSAINAEPSRIDLKKRLLDVLVESNDEAAFEQEATKLSGLDNELDQHIAMLRPRLQGGAVSQEDDDLSFDDLAMDLTAEPAAPSLDSGAADDEEELSLDFTTSSSGSNDSLDTGDTLTLDDGESGLDDLGDFDLELPDAREEEAPATSSPASSAPAANNRYSLNEVDDLSEEEVSASLSADSLLELDSGAGTLDDGDLDFGELKLDDVSDEFSGVDSGPATIDEDDLDLSLDDLELDTPSDNRRLQDDDLELTLDDIELDEPDAGDHGLRDHSRDDSLDVALTDSELTDSASGETTLDDVSLDDLSLDDEALDEEPGAQPPAEPVVTAPPRAAVASLPDDAGLGDDDDFDFLGETDENATKLDLARAYIDMGDTEGARDILNEVVSEGNDQQQSEARDLLSQVG